MKTGIRQQTKTQDMVSIGVFTAVIAVCSWISIPAAVPFTLQTLGVFTAVGVLGGKKGTLAVITYILLGCMGLPVFPALPEESECFWELREDILQVFCVRL